MKLYYKLEDVWHKEHNTVSYGTYEDFIEYFDRINVYIPDDIGRKVSFISINGIDIIESYTNWKDNLYEFIKEYCITGNRIKIKIDYAYNEEANIYYDMELYVIDFITPDQYAELLI